MAKTRTSPKIIFRRRVVVVSLLVQNPTAAKPKETTAEPAPGVTAREARSRRRLHRLAAFVVAALPEEILLWEIFVRLPVKDILSCRAVCRQWRSLTSAPDFILVHHRRQPSLLLLTLKFSKDPIYMPSYGKAYSKADIDRIFEQAYGKVRTDPIFERGHLLTLYGTASTNPILEHDYSSPGFKIHASCNGLLLLSLSDAYCSDGSFSISNPATRQCAPLPCLTAAGCINVVAFYYHHPSSEYRILYWKGRHQGHLNDGYYILTVQQGSLPRCIGVPSHTPGTEKVMLALNETTTTDLAPPVAFRNCLHWDPGYQAGMLVFDTVVESFRLMRRPADAATSGTCLCDMEGSIGFSCFAGWWREDVKIWVLEDYDREVWSFKYHVKFPVGILSIHSDRQYFVLSHKGDVLVYSPGLLYMIHCDNTGKLIEEFQLNSWSKSIIGPWVKESLVKPDFYLDSGNVK
ncbi:uncharacterized protein [Lolium perenne]|uniref:uncharacterized protein n=1 Tax=Lolium perenne TaxID=4522 RepID=UPI003A996256